MNIILLLFSILILATIPSLSQSKSNSDSSITLTGLVYIEYLYEQACYGETPNSDATVGVCLIKADESQNITLYKGQELEILHLILPDSLKITCNKLAGHRIEATGHTDVIHTGHHHGDALLDVDKYSILR